MVVPANPEKLTIRAGGMPVVVCRPGSDLLHDRGLIEAARGAFQKSGEPVDDDRFRGDTLPGERLDGGGV